MEHPRPRRILPLIVASQLAGTSLWFAGNAVLGELQTEHDLGAGALGWMTSSVQLGFITGTLVSAWWVLADRFSPRWLFLACSLLGALFNLGILLASGPATVFACRFLTGVCLAGIYPVGMKIAAGWYRQGLGRAIGFLVGALVLGTALPHLVRSLGGEAGALPWRGVLVVVSALAVAGGLLMALGVPDGPYLGRGAPLRSGALRAIFASREFRSSAFGYFGHMWELYTWWAFVPALLAYHAARHGGFGDVSLAAFAVIAAGSVGCVAGGLVARRFGSARVAAVQLAVSGLCCLLLPWVVAAPAPVYLVFLLLWGVTVVGDSPQFSTLNARTAPPELVGSALTVATCIGFALTIASIQLTSALRHVLGLPWLFPLLAVGPAFGLVALRPLRDDGPEGAAPPMPVSKRL